MFVTALTTAATENTLVGQATESSCEGQDVHKASSTASVIASNVVPHNPNTTSQDGILDDSTLRSDELHLKKSVSHIWFPAVTFEYMYMHLPTHVHIHMPV